MSIKDDVVRNITSFGSASFMIFIFIGLLSLGKNTLALEFFSAVMISQVLIYLVRVVYFRARPGKKREKYRNFYERLDASSFPSIHASRAAIIPMILSQGLGVYPSVLLWSVGFLICVSRIVLKRHHPTDVLTGFVLGILISYGLTVFWVF